MMIKNSNKSTLKIYIRLAVFILLIVSLLLIIYLASSQNSTESNRLSSALAQLVNKETSSRGKGVYLKLVRKDDVFTGYCSSNGWFWHKIRDPVKAELKRNVLIGLAVTSRSDNKLCTAKFDNVKVNGIAPSSVQKSWIGMDIGKVNIKGSSRHDNGVYTIQGSGTDFLYGPDGFHYYYSELDGNGIITARLTDMDDTHTWAKAGLMIRESQDAKSKFVDVISTPNGLVMFKWRTGSKPCYKATRVLDNEYNILIRKAFHFLEFLILSVLIYLLVSLLKAKRGIAIAAALLLCTVFAGLDEFHQTFVPGRTSSMLDVFIDISGALFGLFVINIVLLITSKTRRNQKYKS